MNAYKCQKCDHTTSRRTSLAQHVKRLHEEDEDPDFSPEDVTYKSPAKLGKRSLPSDLHNEGEISDTCDFDSVTNHKVNVHGVNEKSFECEECGFASAWKTSLQEHTQSVHEKKNGYNCEKCEYTSMWPRNVTKHYNNVHEKVKNHRCTHEQCSYATAYRADLVKHMHKLHGASPGQRCKMCDFTSSQRGALIRHFMKVHDNKASHQSVGEPNWKKAKRPAAREGRKTEDEESEDYETGEDEGQEDVENDLELRCKIPDTTVKCGKLPEDKPGRAKMYRCDKCDHASSRKSSLAQHIVRVHQEEEEEEEEEGDESDQSDEDGLDSPPQAENSTRSVKIVCEEEDSNSKGGGEVGSVPPKRAPLALYNKALKDPDQTKSANFAIPISLESLGFLDGVCPNTTKQ